MSEFDTRAVHVGQDPVKWPYRPVVGPIVLTSRDDEVHRADNSTKKSLEECIASLEHAKHALCFPSGLGAVSSVAQLLEDGDHAIIFDSVYHGTRTYLTICEDLGKLEVSFLDLRDLKILEKNLKSNTKLVWIETPCNPTMKLVDISAVSQILKKHKDVILVVDNTFMTPYFQNPLLLGADIVLHSLTKFMSGHTDVLMGAVATNSDFLHNKLKDNEKKIGAFPSPLDCFMVRRGLKTLHLRMPRHMENATRVALFLESHSKVEKVFYPGLKSHPQHELALTQCKGFSGMVSCRVKGGTTEATVFVQRLKLFTLAVSLGSTESLAEIPSLMTASSLTREQRQELEIYDNLIRLSIGLESVEDLIKDLDQALQGM